MLDLKDQLEKLRLVRASLYIQQYKLCVLHIPGICILIYLVFFFYTNC